MVQTNSITSPKERVIVIGGPTCVGKSEYAVDVALKYGGEVVSADSVQIYRGLDIGSGKITTEEMRGVPHHMLDIVDPSENNFSVAMYIERAKHTITDIIQRGKLPIIVGGTGFYINALLHGYNCGGSGPNYKLRRRLQALQAKHKNNYLYDKLVKITPWTTVHENDLVRIIRQLELLLSPHCDRDDSTAVYCDAYDAVLVIMDADREKLDERAARRIEGMFAAGLMKEVEGLRDYFENRCMDSVGYREVADGITYGRSEDKIKEDMKISYHRLIKKQQTFFRWLQWKNKVSLYNWERTTADECIDKFVRSGQNG